MKVAITLLASFFLGCTALAQEGGQTEKPGVPTVGRLTEIERLYRAYGITHGGRQALKDIKTLSFRMIPVFITEEGEVEGQPIKVDAQLEGVDRMMRLEEETEGQSVVKFANGIDESAVWINGEQREIPERLFEARQESQVFYLMLDLLLKPESDDVKANFVGKKKRDGRQHYAVEFEFHPSRMLENTYRVFYDENDGFVRRIDIHDTRTNGNIRINTLRLSQYAPTAAAVVQGKLDIALAVKNATDKLEAATTPEEKAAAEKLIERAKVADRTPQFPARIEISNRDNDTAVIWRMVDVAVNGEFEPGHFSEP